MKSEIVFNLMLLLAVVLADSEIMELCKVNCLHCIVVANLGCFMAGIGFGLLIKRR